MGGKFFSGRGVGFGVGTFRDLAPFPHLPLVLWTSLTYQHLKNIIMKYVDAIILQLLPVLSLTHNFLLTTVSPLLSLSSPLLPYPLPLPTQVPGAALASGGASGAPPSAPLDCPPGEAAGLEWG